MPHYNVYADEYGRMTRVYSFTAIDDEAAKEVVTHRLTDVPVELWRYSKRLARFESKGELSRGSQIT